MERYKLGAIIFSRLDSKRLFGKALLDIEGKCLLERVILRTKNISGISKIIVATSDRDIDSPIAKFVSKKKDIQIFRGSCDDVFGRALEACKKFGLDGFARICGDRPFFDFELVSKGISIFRNSGSDIVTTMHPRSYPPGLTTEIISKELLMKFENIVKTKFDREHLTTFFYKNPENIKIQNIPNSNYEKIRSIRLVVDNESDLKRAKYIASHENKQLQEISIEKILSLALEFDTHSRVE